MIEQALSILFAIFSLGLLVFIHELGHFWVAKREGMVVEAFSIGFGPPIFSWTRKGVQWQVCWIFFGGYVKIAGMQREGSREPYEIVGGFFSKRPIQRIRVALAGPLVNITFSLVIFSFLWLLGGREKPFSEYTHHVGWIDSKSTLYQKGIRPGDRVDFYNGQPFTGVKDLYIASILKSDAARVSGVTFDPYTGAEKSFDYTVPSKEVGKGILFVPANYCIFKGAVPTSPIVKTGIKEGDRILWADGEVIYSLSQLQAVVNRSTAFVTVQRGGEVLQVKIPRIKLGELRLSATQRAEFDDWQHDAGVQGRLSDLYFIPYLLSPKGAVEAQVSLFDLKNGTALLSQEGTLQEGDRILALGGQPVHSSYDFLQKLQARHVLMIIQRDPTLLESLPWRDADLSFEKSFARADLHSLVSQIGLSNRLKQEGDLLLLPAVEPKPVSNFSTSSQTKGVLELKKKIEAIQDPQKRQEALKLFEKEQGTLMLGAVFRDREIRYNPTPLSQFVDTFQEAGLVLRNLFAGNLHPKNVSGPVGIIHVVQKSWFVGGGKESLFWMAMISFNLGLVNLLPIPVLDGGHIMFSLYEAVTKRRLSSKVMERLVIPFVGLLVLLFLYITYQDIARLFSRFF